MPARAARRRSVTGAVVGLVLLCGVGWLPATTIAGLSVSTVFLSVLVSTALSTLAAVLAVGVAGTPLPWFVGAALVANVGCLLIGPPSRSAVLPWSTGLAPLGGVLLGLVATVSPRVGYDAHAIWLLHSRLLIAGHDDYVAALGFDAFLFTNPDYPPAAPSTVAVIWQVTEVNTRSGQLLIAILTAAAVGLLATGVLRVAASAPRGVRAVVGIALPVVGFGIAGGTGTVGYVDLLWSAAVTAAAVWGLLAVRSPTNAHVALLAAVVGGSTKQEGLVLASVVIVLIAVRYRDCLRAVGSAIAGAAAALLSWPVVVRIQGGGSELAERSQLRELLRGDPEVWSRLPPSVSALRVNTGFMLLVGVTCTVAGVVALNGRRRHDGIGSPFWLWVLVVAHTGALLTAYLISGYDLDYHLSHSITRTTIVVNLLLVVDVAVWLCLACAETATRLRRYAA